MSQEFDANLYVFLPVFDAREGCALATALIERLPRPTPSSVLRAAEALIQSTHRLLEPIGNLVARLGPVAEEPERVLRTAWTALFMRLYALASLSAEFVHGVSRAQRLVEALFEHELSFLDPGSIKAWTESERRLIEIDERGWAKELSDLAGTEYLIEVRRAQARFGESIGLGKAAVFEPAPLRIEQLRRLRRAIQAYVLQVLASRVGADPEAVERALAPLASLGRAETCRPQSALASPVS